MMRTPNLRATVSDLERALEQEADVKSGSGFEFVGHVSNKEEPGRKWKRLGGDTSLYPCAHSLIVVPKLCGGAMASPAARARARHLERKATQSRMREDDAASDDAASEEEESVQVRTNDGKSKRTGAQLVLPASDDDAAKLLPHLAERKQSMINKGHSRKMWDVTSELPLTSANMAQMPRMQTYPKTAAGRAKHGEDYMEWHKKAIRAQVMQRRCAATYEKHVGRVNDFMVRQGHEPFVEWVQPGNQGGTSEGWTLVLCMDGDEPRVPTVPSICEWCFCYATGQAKKGGDKEYRAGPWYAKLRGRTQAEILMPEDKERAYGKKCCMFICI